MFLLLAIGLSWVARCSGQEDSFYPPKAPTLETFDWQLLKEFESANTNLVISPISLKLVMALLYEGSSGNTEREFGNVFQFHNKETVRNQYNQTVQALRSHNTVNQLDIGTKVFLEKGRQPQTTFATIAKSAYDAEIEQIDFNNTKSAAQSINGWISDLTKGKISEVIKADDLTRSIMVVANALFFKGTWTYPFPRNLSFPGQFSITPKETVEVDYMTTINEFYQWDLNDLDASVLRLPYKGNQYSFWIILPKSKGGLSDLIKRINPSHIYESIYNVEKRTVHVTLPKFKFEFKKNYVHLLKKLGLREMFQNTASFPGIVRGPSSILRVLQVSDVVQQSGIEVDEDGSVVYSATGINIGNKFGEGVVSFNASHPFMFFLYEEQASTIVYLGKVGNPRSAENRFTQQQVEDKFSGGDVAVPQGFPQHHQPPQEVSFLQPSYAPQPQPQQEQEIVYNRFDFQLLRGFAAETDNVLISPLSIKTTLAMLLEGAKGNSAREIQMALRLGGTEQSRIRSYLGQLLQQLRRTQYMDISNTVFVSNKVQVSDAYRRLLDSYKGYVQSLDFSNVPAAVQAINQWVNDITRGAIPTIVSSESVYKDTLVLVANALFFKGQWETAFDEKSTRPDYFFIDSKQAPLVDMMQVTNNFNYTNYLHSDIIDLPYQQEFSMLIAMPGEYSNIANLADDIHDLGAILDRMNSTEINLSMPKFEVEYSKDLVDVLKPMGVQEIFGPQANLTGIVNRDNVQVNKIVHKTKIEVDENGTKAAAATGALVIPLIGSTAKRLSINRPFIYFIYHRPTRSIVFEGIYRNPRAVRVAPQRQPINTQSRLGYVNY